MRFSESKNYTKRSFKILTFEGQQIHAVIIKAKLGKSKNKLVFATKIYLRQILICLNTIDRKKRSKNLVKKV